LNSFCNTIRLCHVAWHTAPLRRKAFFAWPDKSIKSTQDDLKCSL
jgi:hypothetical protein